MSSAIVMPKVGLTMTEGKIVEWRKSVGDRVELGEIIFVFETEKVSFDVEATQAGYVSKIIVPEGDTVPIGVEVALLDGEQGASSAASTQKLTTQHDAGLASDVAGSPPHFAEKSRESGRLRATPLARRIAKSNGVELVKVVAASGGAVKKRDVESYVARLATASAAAPEPAPARDAASTVAPLDGRVVKPSSMRAIIARKMMASTTETAQAYMLVTVDAGHLIEARGRLMPSIEKQTGVRPTLTDVLAKIVAVAIERHPVMNTRWTDDGIVWLDAIHMGIATALDDGLVVPVIRNIGSKKLSDIAVERSSLVERARSGKLPPEDMKGGTFSISSLGMFGVEEFSAILNQPESGILAVGAIIDTPVARDGAVVVRPMMKLTLTYDHRIIDGAKAAAFVATLKEVVEEPLLALA
jgi:pyruvate dehydrogenase E2 component (dihydrolipoamide acetyltransferase)